MRDVKILTIDIETIANLTWSWQVRARSGWNAIDTEMEWDILSFGAKWYGKKTEYYALDLEKKPVVKRLKNGSTTITPPDNKKLLDKLWELLDEADIVVGWNCVHVDTPVLKQDLTWVKAGDLKEGDKLVGFEEKIPPGETVRSNDGQWKGVSGKARQVVPTEVTGHRVEEAECMEVFFDDGTSVITTKDHYWLGMAEKDRNQRWYQTQKLRVGQRVNKFTEPWEVDKSYEAGWLSGFIAGEGTLKKDRTKVPASIDYCQRPTSTWEQALEYSRKLGIDISSPVTKKTGSGRGDVQYVYTRGGKWETIRLIGTLQIARFLEKIDWNNFGGLNAKTGGNTRTIVGIEDVGMKPVAVMSTGSKTFIAAGYPMHNCDAFDLKKINAKLIAAGYQPPSPCQTVDVMKKKRQLTASNSNKLNDTGIEWGLGGKVEHDGWDLWMGCMEGDAKSLRLMKKYCIRDVDLTEEAYTYLLPWMKTHPSMSVLSGRPNHCNKCLSHRVHAGMKYRATNTNLYQYFRCVDCGGMQKSRIPELQEKPLYSN